MNSLFQRTKKILTFKLTWFVLLIALFSLFTRFYHLNFESYWLDELYSASYVNPDFPLRSILHDLGQDVHPPLHYFLSYFVFKTFGYTDFVVELFRAFWGYQGF